MPNDELVSVLQEAYDDSAYPEAFLAEYAIMECLAERSGIDTFLVQDAKGANYIAKCYAKHAWLIDGEGEGDSGDESKRDTGHDDILSAIDHPAIPKAVGTFVSNTMLVTVRTYVEGVTLDRYAREHDLSEQEITSICMQLCDILAHLHHRTDPIIHRDIKPQNIVVRPEGTVALIDFDIARVYRAENDTDTRFFGTLAYAPPEQYGFAQTDARTDIYSLGVLLRYLLTGSPRENKNVRVYRPLDKIIRKCTAFAPKERYSDIDQVKKALSRANPTWQNARIAGIVVSMLIVVALLAFAGVKAYEAATYSPFNGEHTPAVLSDEARIDEAVIFMKDKYGTHLFDGDTGEVATVGLLRSMLIELYGLDRDYVYAHQDDGLPGESDEWFMAWGWGDEQHMSRDYTVYAAVKVHDPSIVAEIQWSKLKDDNGEYPGTRVAVMFADEHGITNGVGRPYDITVGDMALIFANADRVFEK